MHTEFARPEHAPAIAAVLREAAQWLIDRQMPLWAVADFSDAAVWRDVHHGQYMVATSEANEVAGVVRYQLEGVFFWPEVEPGTSAFLHKLAVRRSWAGQGISAALLAFARDCTPCGWTAWPIASGCVCCTRALVLRCTTACA